MKKHGNLTQEQNLFFNTCSKNKNKKSFLTLFPHPVASWSCCSSFALRTAAKLHFLLWDYLKLLSNRVTACMRKGTYFLFFSLSWVKSVLEALGEFDASFIFRFVVSVLHFG